MNEDVFSAPAFTEEKNIDSDIHEITEQIHRLLLQVHSFSYIHTHKQCTRAIDWQYSICVCKAKTMCIVKSATNKHVCLAAGPQHGLQWLW